MKHRIALPFVLVAGLSAFSPACSSAKDEKGAAGTGGAGVSSTSTSASGGSTGSGVSSSASTGSGSTGSGAPSSGSTGAGGASVAGSTGSSASAASSTSGSGSSSAASSSGGATAQPFKGVALYEVSTCPDLATLELSWYYNWTTTTGCTTSAEFVPQIWGHSGEPIATEVTKAVASGHTTILGFNEPDNSGQSNMTVAAAVALWPELQQTGVEHLGSPATSANSAGQTWFEQFMTQVKAKGLRVDFIALHWYGWNSGSCNDASALDSYLKWAEQWNLPLWITEFGCLNDSDPTAAVVKTFYDDDIVMFQKHPLLQRYGWYLSRATDNTALIDSTTSTLTPLGTDYAAAPSDK